MNIKCRLVLVGTLTFAGCASAPEQPAESPAVAALVAAEAEGAADSTGSAAPTEGFPTIELSKLVDTNPVTCRDLLITGSNVMRTQCMTRHDWKIWDQAQRIWAQDMLLRMQGLKR